MSDTNGTNNMNDTNKNTNLKLIGLACYYDPSTGQSMRKVRAWVCMNGLLHVSMNDFDSESEVARKATKQETDESFAASDEGWIWTMIPLELWLSIGGAL